MITTTHTRLEKSTNGAISAVEFHVTLSTAKIVIYSPNQPIRTKTVRRDAARSYYRQLIRSGYLPAKIWKTKTTQTTHTRKEIIS